MLPTLCIHTKIWVWYCFNCMSRWRHLLELTMLGWLIVTSVSACFVWSLSLAYTYSICSDSKSLKGIEIASPSSTPYWRNSHSTSWFQASYPCFSLTNELIVRFNAYVARQKKLSGYSPKYSLMRPHDRPRTHLPWQVQFPLESTMPSWLVCPCTIRSNPT
jgi:hypothetical protein